MNATTHRLEYRSAIRIDSTTEQTVYLIACCARTHLEHDVLDVFVPDGVGVCLAGLGQLAGMRVAGRVLGRDGWFVHAEYRKQGTGFVACAGRETTQNANERLRPR